nr:MAG TPA: PP2A A subunit, PP2A C, phosphatase, PP2A, HYDROLASE.8A [Caudoviricetes sp.]
MEKATIYDYARMCNTNEFCSDCPMNESDEDCYDLMRENPDKANEIILKWCKEHPVKTRQSEFLKMFPNVVFINDEVINICPDIIDSQYGADCTRLTCDECRKKYWLAEAEE